MGGSKEVRGVGKKWEEKAGQGGEKGGMEGTKRKNEIGKVGWQTGKE